jgi:Cu-processing system permease protein
MTALSSVTERQERDRLDLGSVRALAAKELRDALADRWLWLYGASFAVLGAGLGILAVSDAETVGFSGFGRTAASLVALAQLVVPLMGLTIGARSLAGQRERGTLAFLLSHPVSPTEVYLGTFAGSALAMLAAVAGGFGVAGLVASLRGAAVGAGDLVVIALLGWLLAVAMIAVGMLVSIHASRTATAMGIALVLWLVFVFFGNLGLMGTSIATGLSDGVLFSAATINPVEAYRLSAMSTLGGSLDVLGPVGTYAIDRFGDRVGVVTGAMVAVWIAVPLLAGLWSFRRGPDR